MLLRIPAARQKLFVGDESEMWTKQLVLPAGDVTVSLRELADNHFDTLPQVIGDAAFQQVISEGGFQKTAIGTYTDEDKMSLVYLLRDETLFILGTRETNPGRYRVMFEGAWRIS